MVRKNVVCLALALFAVTILFSALSFAGKPLRTVSLDVTIEDSDTAIRSDGHGAYSDGENVLSAALTSGGNFAVFFGPPSQHGKTQSSTDERKVCFDFSNSLNLSCPKGLSCDGDIPFSYDCIGGSDLVTRPDPDSNYEYIPLQNLVPGDSEIVELFWTLHLEDGNWRIDFHSGLADYIGSPSAYAIVTCDVESALPCSKWTVEPYQPDLGDPYSSPVAFLVKGEMVKNNQVLTPELFLNMPFRLILEAK